MIYWRALASGENYATGPAVVPFPERTEMGIFWKPQPHPQPLVMQHFRAALAAPPPPTADLDQQAQELATAVASAAPAQTGEVNKGNLITAILIVVAFVGAGIGTDAAGL